MKKLFLAILIVAPLFCSAQNVILKTDTVSVWVGANQYPINSIVANWNDADSSVTFSRLNGGIAEDSKKYYRYTNTSGTPFTSMAALKLWVKNFFVDASSVLSAGGLQGKGGHSLMTADGTTTVFNIVTNAGYVPSFFTLTTTTPITQNQLNRTISFPDNNTMRITFQNAPLIGENTDYVWIVFK